jgi:hypothetical protein
MNYGQPISIVSKPEMSGAMWAARAFCSSYGVTEIFLTDPDVPGELFLVLSCQPSNERLYSCRAILAKELERDSDRIEEDIVRLSQK